MDFILRLKGRVFLAYLLILALIAGTGLGFNTAPVLAEDSTVIAIATGGSHSLALKSDGTVWAWGNNSDGQLGDGSTTSRYYPVQVRDGAGEGFLQDVVALAAGSNHSLALKKDGTVWAWGNNDSGQLGDGGYEASTLPIQVSNADSSDYLENIRAISAGYHNSFAIDKTGQAWAWGWNYTGQLGIGTSTNRERYPTPVQELTNVSQISSSSSHTLALKKDKTVWAWGEGSLGTGTNFSNVPRQVVGPNGDGFLSGMAMVATSRHSDSFALSLDNTIYKWGSFPQIVEGLSDVTSLVPRSSSDFIALKNDGQVLQYSYGHYSVIKDLSNIISISGNYNHYLALDAEGQIWAWGNNNYGQLGNGSTESSSSPVKVDFGTSYDNSPPEIINTYPAADDSAVALNSIITVTFNEPVKAGSRFASIVVLNKHGNAISLKEKSLTANTLTLIPLNVLDLHSDGDKELIKGELINDKDGVPIAIKFNTSKFSTFAIIKLSEQPKIAGNDINGNWAEASIRKLLELGAITGYPDGTFRPNQNITRAEFTTILVNAFKLSPAKGKPFSDTTEHWAEDYIATATAHGIVQGYSDTVFAPEQLITREQMAVMIVKICAVEKIADSKQFSDTDQISSWAKEAIDIATGHQLISGYPDGSFKPLNNATRAEVATLIVTALNK